MWHFPHYSIASHKEYFLQIILIFVPPTLAGALVFHGDQAGRSYLFLCERGVKRGLFWLSRQALGMALLLLWLVLLICLTRISGLGETFFWYQRSGLTLAPVFLCSIDSHTRRRSRL